MAEKKGGVTGYVLALKKKPETGGPGWASAEVAGWPWLVFETREKAEACRDWLADAGIESSKMRSARNLRVVEVLIAEVARDEERTKPSDQF